jgi:hypothetical protein
MKRKKIKYDIANNGAEAVNKWKSGGFHLILVSLNSVSSWAVRLLLGPL